MVSELDVADPAEVELPDVPEGLDGDWLPFWMQPVTVTF